MNFRKRGLGKGLSDLGLGELLGGAEDTSVAVLEREQPIAENAQEKITTTGLTNLPIDQLKPGKYQPRQQFSSEKLEELADSIRAQGIIQPIVVRPVEEGYEILAGERRWRASQMAGLTEVPVVVRDIPDESAMALSLIENIQRQDLNAIEQAQALQRLISEFNLTHEEAAKAVGKSRVAITNLLRLLKLDLRVRTYLQEGKIEMGHARALLSLPEDDQAILAKKIIDKDLSVRETENLVKAHFAEDEEALATSYNIDPNIKRLEKDLSDKLAAKIAIQHQANGKGKLVIHYNSTDELDGILEHIK